MRKIKSVFALLAAALALTTAAFAAEPGDALVPVGETVAISLRCDGVVVSALADIASEGGACCPAGEAGVQAGDKIVAVNGERVTGAEDFLRRAAAFSGEGVTLSVERGGETKTFAVTPKLGSGGTYQIGLWLRDAVRGLGTVTFYDPATGEYGALGHGVGLFIHEQPRVAHGSSTVLVPGHVITIEPGIYIPGLGGCRIEDMAIITSDGYIDPITAPKQLIEL